MWERKEQRTQFCFHGSDIRAGFLKDLPKGGEGRGEILSRRSFMYKGTKDAFGLHSGAVEGVG